MRLCSRSLDQDDPPSQHLHGQSLLQAFHDKCVVAWQIVMKALRHGHRNDGGAAELSRRAWADATDDVAERVVPARIDTQVFGEAFPADLGRKFLVAAEGRFVSID